MARFSPRGRWAEGTVRSTDFRLKLKEFLRSLSYNQWSKQQGKGKNLSGRIQQVDLSAACDRSGVFWVPRWWGSKANLFVPRVICVRYLDTSFLESGPFIHSSSSKYSVRKGDMEGQRLGLLATRVDLGSQENPSQQIQSFSSRPRGDLQKYIVGVRLSKLQCLYSSSKLLVLN